MKLKPQPQYMHVMLVECRERKVKDLIIREKMGCAIGRVVANACRKEITKDIQPGALVLFRPDNFNFLMQDDDGTNGILYEDAVMCEADKESFKGEIVDSLNCIREYGKPGIVGVDHSGATIGRPTKQNYG